MTLSQERPLATFYVMAYRQEALVHEAIQGAFAQAYEPLEIVLSDDCSPDGTFRVMEEMAAAYDGPHRVILNRNPTNLGLTAHIDRIMEISSGEFVVQNAGDDISRPDRTEKLVKAWLASGRRAKAVHSAIAIINANGEQTGTRRSPPLMISDRTPLNIIRHDLYAHGASLGWSRDVFDIFGPIAPDAIVEDMVIPFRASLIGTVGFLDENLIYWRTGGLSSQHHPRPGWDRLYGIRLRLRRWRVGTLKCQIKDAKYLPEKERMPVLTEAYKALQTARFDLDLAQASRAKRILMVSQALRLAFRHRDSSIARQWLRYLLDWLYIFWMDVRTRKPFKAS